MCFLGSLSWANHMQFLQYPYGDLNLKSPYDNRVHNLYSARTRISQEHAMSIKFDTSFVRTLIDERFGSVAQLVDHWDMRVSEGIQKVGKARDVSNVHKWLKNNFPKQEEAVFGLAAALDIDPLALAEISPQHLNHQLNLTRRLFQDGFFDGSLLPPFWSLYRAVDGWPNDQLATGFYDRRWHAVDFIHEPPANIGVYAATLLSPEGGIRSPLVFHFAFRRLNVPDQRWRPYGAVLAYNDCVKLVSGSGDYQERSRTSDFVPVETQFGAGPAEFKIASLHPFTFELEVPSQQSNAVRFVA